MTVIVGLLDSGAGDLPGANLIEQKSFLSDESGDLSGHGAQVAGVIISADPSLKLLSAQVFSNQGAGTPAIVAAGLEWLVEAGAQLVCMSFGLRADRPALRHACQGASDAGLVLIASAPAQGDPVYPAAYDSVIAVTGDARCAPGEFSLLEPARAKFGACVYPEGGEPGIPGLSGASIAAAHAVRDAADFMSSHPEARSTDIETHFTALCRYHGVERRTE